MAIIIFGEIWLWLYSYNIMAIIIFGEIWLWFYSYNGNDNDPLVIKRGLLETPRTKWRFLMGKSPYTLGIYHCHV